MMQINWFVQWQAGRSSSADLQMKQTDQVLLPGLPWRPGHHREPGCLLQVEHWHGLQWTGDDESALCQRRRVTWLRPSNPSARLHRSDPHRKWAASFPEILISSNTSPSPCSPSCPPPPTPSRFTGSVNASESRPGSSRISAPPPPHRLITVIDQDSVFKAEDWLLGACMMLSSSPSMHPVCLYLLYEEEVVWSRTGAKNTEKLRHKLSAGCHISTNISIQTHSQTLSSWC